MLIILLSLSLSFRLRNPGLNEHFIKENVFTSYPAPKTPIGNPVVFNAIRM